MRGMSLFQYAVESEAYKVEKNWLCKECEGNCTCARKSVTVEVIVPTHNHEKYITQCLASIASQELSDSISIVIHDDSSVDSTHEECLDFMERSQIPTTYFLAKRNRLRHDKFSFFLELLQSTRATYVAILDGDDYWSDSCKLRLQIDLLKTNSNAVLCHTRYEVLDLVRKRRLRQPDAELSTVNLEDKNLLFKENFIGTPTVLMKSSPQTLSRLISVFGKFEISDYPIWCTLLAESADKRMVFLEKSTAVHRVHGANYWATDGFISKVVRARRSQRLISSTLGMPIGDSVIVAVLRVVLRRMRGLRKLT